MATKKKEPVLPEVSIRTRVWQVMDFCLIGETPFIHNRLATPSIKELILPSTDNEKKVEKDDGVPKSDPVAAFQASPYTMRAPSSPTLLAAIAPMFKASMRDTAGMVEGLTIKAVKRIVHVRGERLALFGGPTTVWMAQVGGPGYNAAPMIRFRARTEEWACRISVQFLTPPLSVEGISELLAFAGRVTGVGDGRVNLGAYDMGRFRIVAPTDPEFIRIVSTGGRDAQIADMDACAGYDDETAEILAWYEAKIDARQKRKMLRRPGVLMDRPPNRRQKAIAAAAAGASS